MSEDTTRRFYDRISGAYDALADSSEGAAREKGFELLAPQAGERILEIGFGTGHMLVELAQRVGPSGHVDGVDISTGMKSVAEKRIADANVQDRVSLQIADVPPLPFADGQFDAVFMSFTLELFPLDVIPQVLHEVGRVLKEGGRLANVSMAVTELRREKESLLERTYVWMHRHFPHIVDCQPIDAVPLLRDAGFDVTAEERLQIWTMPVDAVVAVYSSERFVDAAQRAAARRRTVVTLIDQLASTDPQERVTARQRICAQGRDAVPPLIEALNDRRHQVQWEAAKCLTMVSKPADAKQLVERLSHEDNDVRWLIADALVQLGDAGMIAVLDLLASSEGEPEFELYQGARHVLRELSVHGKSALLHDVLDSLSHQQKRIGVPAEAAKVLERLRADSP